MLNDSYGISFFSFYFKTGHSSSLVQTFSVMGNEELRDESNGFFSGLFSALIWFRSFWNYYYFYLLSPLPLFLSWNAVRLSLWVRGYVLWIRFLCCFWDWLFFPCKTVSSWLKITLLVHRDEGTLCTGWRNPVCVFLYDAKSSFWPRNRASLLCFSEVFAHCSECSLTPLFYPIGGNEWLLSLVSLW